MLRRLLVKEFGNDQGFIALQDEAALKLGVMFFFEYIETGALNVSAV